MLPRLLIVLLWATICPISTSARADSPPVERWREASEDVGHGNVYLPISVVRSWVEDDRFISRRHEALIPAPQIAVNKRRRSVVL